MSKKLKSVNGSKSKYLGKAAPEAKDGQEAVVAALEHVTQGNNLKVHQDTEMSLMEGAQLTQEEAEARAMQFMGVKSLTPADREIITKAREVTARMQGTVVVFLDLCTSIRDSQTPPALYKKLLKGAGFPRSRVSEISMVCDCSPQLFEDYRRRFTGFRATLAKARAEKNGASAGADSDSADGQAVNEKDVSQNAPATAVGSVPERFTYLENEEFVRQVVEFLAGLKSVAGAFRMKLNDSEDIKFSVAKVAVAK